MKLLREPLLHFAVIGAALFAGYAWLHPKIASPGTEDRAIRITEREVTWLAETSARAWQHAPSDKELEGLLAEYLREELLAREARALELDRDDTVVRRRLAQKMSFILEGASRLASPTDADLRARFDADPSRFRKAARSSFRQVYFSEGKRGESAASAARAALARLTNGTRQVEPDALGDATLLPATLDDVDEQTIAVTFGAEFARAVAASEPGTWHGPIDSDFGIHLVLVTKREEGQPRTFEEVRTELLDQWNREQDAAAKALYFSGLVRKYDIQATGDAQRLLGPALSLLGSGSP